MLKLTLLSCGNKMPEWVHLASSEFIKRLREFCKPNLIEVPLTKRSNPQQLPAILEKETQLILNAIPKQSYCIALDIKGKSFSSEAVATKLESLQLKQSHLCFIIGGPEGLSTTVVQRCNERWSLSPMTFPHPLARVMLCEALYRSFTILQNHPYHK